jgi:hypothetical protein
MVHTPGAPVALEKVPFCASEREQTSTPSASRQVGGGES